MCRYGTGPLRRYIDILAQRQMAAILRGSGYLNKTELIETVRVSYARERAAKKITMRDRQREEGERERTSISENEREGETETETEERRGE